MKILMIAPQPFFEPRGTPISVYQRLHGLSALNYQVDLVTYHIGMDVEVPGVTIHRIPSVPFIKKVKIGPSFSKFILDILVLIKAFLLLLNNRYDVIHSHEEAGVFSTFLAALFRTNHLYDMHSSLPQQMAASSLGRYRPLIKLFEFLERWVIYSCDSMLTIGTDLEEHAAKINPAVKQTRIENLPVHVVEPAPDQCAIAEIRERLGLNGHVPIVYTGTFEHYQGLDLLFESAKSVVRQHPEVRFVLVGGEPGQIEHWKTVIKQDGLEDYFCFAGIVTPAETLAYLELAEILVSPRTEGLSVPLKIYTYLYSGKPIVATSLLAHTQILDETNAVLASPSQEAFAEGVIKLIENLALGQQLGIEAQKLAKKKYSAANYHAKLERVYQNLFFPSESPRTSVGVPSKELVES